jgi:hypothetical protein
MNLLWKRIETHCSRIKKKPKKQKKRRAQSTKTQEQITLRPKINLFSERTPETA